MRECNILACDPSITAWGWAIINEHNNIIARGCIKTEPSYKKNRIRVSDDRTNRAGYIAEILITLIEEYNIKIILTEMPHGSQNAKASVMIGIVIGFFACLNKTMDIPIEYYSEQDSKKALLGRKDGSKQDVINAVDKIYDVPWTGTKYIDEAVADSIAVHYVATKQSQILKMIRR